MFYNISLVVIYNVKRTGPKTDPCGSPSFWPRSLFFFHSFIYFIFVCVCARSAGHAADVRHVAGQPPVGWSDSHASSICRREENHHHAHRLPRATGGRLFFRCSLAVQYVKLSPKDATVNQEVSSRFRTPSTAICAAGTVMASDSGRGTSPPRSTRTECSAARGRKKL